MSETAAFNACSKPVKPRHNAAKLGPPSSSSSSSPSSSVRGFPDHLLAAQSQCRSDPPIKEEEFLAPDSPPSPSSSPTLLHSTHRFLENLMVSDEPAPPHQDDFFSLYIDLDRMNSEAVFAPTHSDVIASNLQDAARPGCERNNGGDHKQCNANDEKDSVNRKCIEVIKKAMAADKLAELAVMDPKRAKRILANRQSAARSKERKTRYISELERKVHNLQTQATTLSAQLTMLQRDTSGLTCENSELKLQLESVEHQVQLSDAMNTSLREEIEKLKMMTGQLSECNEEVIAMDHIEQALFTCTGRFREQVSFQGNSFGGIPSTARYLKDAMPAT